MQKRTSAWGGVQADVDNTDKGEGVKNYQIFADVLYGRPLYIWSQY